METKRRNKRHFVTIALLTVVVLMPAATSVAIGDLASATAERLGEGWVATIAFSPDGSVIAAAHRTDLTSARWATQNVTLWDPQTRAQVVELNVRGVRVMAFSPDATILALGRRASGGNTIHLWDVAGQKEVGVIRTPSGVEALAFSPDGKTLAAPAPESGGGTTRLWDVQSLEQIGAVTATWARSVAFSPDGKLLVTAGTRGNMDDTAIKLWDVETLAHVGSLTGHLGATYDLAFNTDGTLLASAGDFDDKAVYLWDMPTQTQMGVLGGHPAHVGSVAFSPDGNLLASTSFWEPAVFLWDVQTQTQVGLLTDHDVSSGLGWRHEVAFSPDGKWLACSSGNGVELWELMAPSVADFNGDGAVDIDDLLRLIESWGLNDPLVDIGPMPWGDGIVDAKDVLVLAEYMVEHASDADDIQ